MDLSTLRRTAAEIAAAAVYEMYPNVELRGGGETDTGFFYDFSFPHPIHSHLIEERMRQIVREKRPIRTLEMVPFSAQELLKKEGHLARAEAIGEGLIGLIQIDSFYDLSFGPHLKNTAELAAFKISVAPLPEKGMRLTGWAHTSKEKLKQFLKQLDHYVEPAELGEKMGLWKGPIWLPQGLKRRQQLIHFLKEQWFGDVFEIAAPAEIDRRSLGKPKVGEIHYDPQQTTLQISFFDRPEEELISSLQSIGKTLTILGFDHSTLSTGGGADYLVEDGLGRSHPIVQVKKVSRKGAAGVDFTWTVGVERMFALLLEKNLLLKMV